MKELKNDLKNQIFRACYLFFGKETFLKKKYETAMKQALIEENSALMNFDCFDDRKISVQRILDSLETMPFLAEKRLVVVKDSGLFQTGRKEDSEKMAEYLSKIPESSCLLFLEEEIDKRGKLYKSVVKYGHAVEFKTPDEKILIIWIKKELKKKKIRIESSAASYLIHTTGGHMEAISGEMEKLSTYLEEGEEASRELIDQLCIKALEVKIFDLVAAIGNQETDVALEIYHNMILTKESPIMILAMIIRQFRLLFQSKYLLEKGEETGGIAQKLGQRDFIIRDCIKQSKNFSLETLKKAMDHCLETDICIKTGKMNGELAVELLILSYGEKGGVKC